MQFFTPCVVSVFEVVQRVNIFKVTHCCCSFLRTNGAQTQKAAPKQIQSGFRAFAMQSKDKAV
jgi:hypothetical protein